MKAGLLLFALIVVCSCFDKNTSVSSKPVIKVNDNEMSAKEFADSLGARLRDLDSLAAKDPGVNQRTKEEILNSFIVRSLMIDWAKKNKIEVSDAELDHEISQIRGLYPDDLSFRRTLADENISFAAWIISIRFNLLERKVSKEINKKIKPATEQELHSFYEENKESFRQKEKIFIHQIVLKDEARADFIKNELKKKTFSDLAIKYSLSPEGPKGGIVGWIEKGSVEYYDPLFKSPLNTVSDPIKTPFGVLLAKVEKKQPERILNFEEAKNKIQRRIIELKEKSEYVSWMDSQLRSSKVFKDTELINSLKIETRGQK